MLLSLFTERLDENQNDMLNSELLFYPVDVFLHKGLIYIRSRLVFRCCCCCVREPMSQSEIA